jgi:hypothetical protein
LLPSALSSPQSMHSSFSECRAACSAPHEVGGSCSLYSCTDVPIGTNCTCTCNADTLSGDGECSEDCSSGFSDSGYCSLP